MGVFDRLRPHREPVLPTLPETALILDNAAVRVRTVEDTVLVALGTREAQALATACRQKEPLSLRTSGRTVTFLPATRNTVVTLDPTAGWLIPLSADERRLLIDCLDAADPAAEVDMGRLAVVVED